MKGNKLKLVFEIEGNSFVGSEKFNPILQILAKSHLQAPDSLEATGKKQVSISGFDDSKVLKAIDRKKYAILLDNSKDQSRTIISQMSDVQLGIYFYSKKESLEVLQIINLFKDIGNQMPLAFGSAHLEDHQKKFFTNNYIERRSFLFDGFLWLNYFGDNELEKQGGEGAISANPYLTKIERFENGLFLQVGESPFDCLTPEGEEQLVNATKALPPIKA